MSFVVPPDFDWHKYISLNKDLCHLEEEGAIEHYIQYGIKENRLYKYILPTDFNSVEYKSLNRDLWHLSDTEIEQHYMLHGRSEDRIYSINNFYSKYPYFNLDLYIKFIDTNLPRINYYILFNQTPIYLIVENDILYHVDVKYFETISDKYDVKTNVLQFIKSNYKLINKNLDCCQTCVLKKFDPDHHTLKYLSMSKNNRNIDLKKYYIILLENYIRKHYDYIYMINIGSDNTECLDDLFNYLSRVKELNNLLFISINHDVIIHNYIKSKLNDFSNYIIIRVPNKGFDIGSFFLSINELKINNISYEYLIRLHTKTSLHWRKELIEPLLNTKETLETITKEMKQYDIHYYGAPNCTKVLDLNNYKLLSKMYPDIYYINNVRFIAGTIFIISKNYIDSFINITGIHTYPLFTSVYTQNRLYDETSIPHAIERSFGIENFIHFSRDTLVIIATYLNNELKYKTLINNIQIFIRSNLKYFVVILTGITNKYNQKFINFSKQLNVEINIISDNDNTAADFGKWYRFLKRQYKYYINYKKYLFTNDSYILTTTIIDYISKSIKYDLYGFINSYENKYHYPSFLFIIRNIVFFISFLNTYVKNIKTVNDVINIEINLRDNFKYLGRECYVDITKYNCDFNIFYRHDDVYSKLLTNNQLPIIKIKRLNYTTYDNYVLPNDFDAKKYRDLYSDLEHLSLTEMETHFINHGMKEGRKYKPEQESSIPKFIHQKLKEVNFDLNTHS